MRQIIKVFFMVFLCLAVSTPISAQRHAYDVVDIKKIASMLIAEKASGQIDDAPFVAYWDSLGFKKDKQVGYNSFAYKKDLSDGNGRERPLTVQITTWDDERCFELNVNDSSLCWYLFIRLKEFGLKGPNAVGKGKGLTAVASKNRLVVSYKLPQKQQTKK